MHDTEQFREFLKSVGDSSGDQRQNTIADPGNTDAAPRGVTRGEERTWGRPDLQDAAAGNMDRRLPVLS